eukprot:TRINITY_DN20074_c0_g1_i2.p1 TRINITY_DN20074_c0_g1~~TRINITY_DN20074_c0_g1_i2.p1  ORF type:complete len:218 (+),score=39.94 TRINITY_DN20074_c0_g1_i2:134-787(+)
MLSLGYALRKPCSGPVGGARVSAKSFAPRQMKSCKKHSPPTQQLLQRDQTTCEDSSIQQPEVCKAHAVSSVPGIDRAAESVSATHSLPLSSRSRKASRCPTPWQTDTDPDALSHLSRRSKSESSLRRPPRPAGTDQAIANLAERSDLLSRGRSRRLRSAGSMASGLSSQASSCWSQAVRSTVLDLELQLERERREAAEKELADLRAQLAASAKNGGC